LLGLSPNHWSGYLHRLALELPGWAGLINWRYQRPQHPANCQAPTDLMDFLAIRLVLDRLTFAAQCRNIGAIPTTVEGLRAYLDRHRSELYVRLSLHQQCLPEYLVVLARQAAPNLWPTVADMIYTWQRSPAAEQPGKHSPHRDGWRLFRLAQHLGLTACDVELLPTEMATRFLETLDILSTNIRGAVWLAAYERRYRDELLNALARNREREPLPHSEGRPAAQIIFCMDDREESFRRHLEEINPEIETLGAPGFFGIAMNWCGLEDSISSPLCPVMVTPTHTVEEQPTTDETMDETQLNLYALRQRIRRTLAILLNHQTRSNPLLAGLTTALASPFMLSGLIGKLFFPAHTHNPKYSAPATRVRFDDYSDADQADQVLNLLLDMGLTSRLGHLVVVMGHGSTSENNPHRAAYACGACGGRHGGPNARVFAA
ncbi:MAG: putative inorganic carbon transporter subunit DabA, partial [Methylococcaceae bacterium]